MCANPAGGVTTPKYDPRPPKAIDGIFAPDIIGWTCPMYAKKDMPVCCINDQVSIMNNSFVSINSVFGEEAGACGVNLRIFFCHYTCHPRQIDFTQYLGIVHKDGTDYAQIKIAVDDDYACKIF